MTDTKAKIEETQKPAMPAGTTDEESAQEAAPVKEEATEVTTESEGLSEEVSDRTREQFNKIKEQRATDKTKYEQDLLNLQTQVSNIGKSKTQVEPEKPLVDPTTGLVNMDQLEKINQRATTAETKVQQLEGQVSQFIDQSQQREAVAAHPGLKEGKDQDKDLHRSARRILMDSMVYPEDYGGQQLSLKEAADVAKDAMGKVKETPEQQEARVSAKEQASFEASGRPSQNIARQTSDEEQERLSVGTRMGDKDAMIARMKNIREASEKK